MVTELGAVGSPVDFATFVMVLVLLVHRVQPRIETTSAAVVALAEKEDHVDADRLRSELDVDDRDVEALRPKIVTDGGPDGDS